MKLSAQLDVNVVAHESTDQVVVLLDLAAPAAVSSERPPSTLQVVLDRSGSMAGAPLEGAKQALTSLLARLEPTDHFGLVVFDDQAQVVVPTGPLHDKARVAALIGCVESGGMTDLSAGYLRALQELRRVGDPGATLLVISDGHVNSGIGDADEFASLARKAHRDGVVTSTLGYGEGYDETLLAAIARGGSGNHVYAADVDAAGAAIAAEVDGLLDKVVQAATLTVRFQPCVGMLHLYNDLPATQLGDGVVQIELGDLYAEEERKLLIKLGINAMAALGLAQVASLELRYVELPGLVEHVMTLPISVNVVPGDQAAGRVPDPVVRSEVLFQEAQQEKRRASEAFERGDLETARTALGATRALIGQALPMAAPAMVASYSAELDDVDQMTELSAPGRQVDGSAMSKLTRASYHRQNRQRGPLSQDGRVVWTASTRDPHRSVTAASVCSNSPTVESSNGRSIHMAVQYAGPAERGRASRRTIEVRPSADHMATAELRTLPEGWFVMHDVASPGHPQDRIPHVVIGPGGVFVIETKDWSGEITLEWGDELRQNGHRRDAVIAHAIEAGDAVANSAPHLAAADVHPVLCVSPDAHVHGRTTHLLACCADGLDALLLSQPRTLTPRQVIQVVCELDSTLLSATGVGHAEDRTLERETPGRLPLLPTSAREATTAVMVLAFFLLMITQPQFVMGWVGDLGSWVGGVFS